MRAMQITQRPRAVFAARCRVLRRLIRMSMMRMPMMRIVDGERSGWMSHSRVGRAAVERRGGAGQRQGHEQAADHEQAERAHASSMAPRGAGAQQKTCIP